MSTQPLLDSDRPRPHPAVCPYCEYDRQFPDTAGGGWMYLGNGGPFVCCPVCNSDGAIPMSGADGDSQ